MRIAKIIGNGTFDGSHIIMSNGEELDGIVSVSYSINNDNRLGLVTFQANAVSMEFHREVIDITPKS